MDREMALWLAELIRQAVEVLEHDPGLTLEVDDHPHLWLQILLEADEETGALKGYILNFPYRSQTGDPLEAIARAGLLAPPDTKILEWEEGGYARIWIRPDAPLLALALFIGDLLEKIVGMPEGETFSVQIEYGY
ncbi:MAG TPA: hypothetical protein ENI95_13135 [Chloroflexi bacterium]|nr:hypothetical protein [Chloroflexota bacterium]